jgi:PAS domain S-box-containing protein
MEKMKGGHSSVVTDPKDKDLISELESRIDDLERQLDELRKEQDSFNGNTTNEALQRSESRLKRAEIASKSGNWELHLDSGIMYGSEGAMKLYGIDEASMSFEKVKEIPLAEFRPALDKALADLIKNGKPYNIEFKIKKADTGEIIDIHSISEFDREKKILFGAIQDISERKRAEEVIIKNNHDLSELLKISLELLETVERKQVFENIVQGAVKLIGVDTGAFYLVDHEHDELYIEVTSPPLPENFPDEFRKASLKNHPHIAKAIASNSPILIRDIETEKLSKEERVITEARQMKSLLYIPLFALKKVVGVVILGTINRKFDFSDREIALCRTLSNIASLSLGTLIMIDQLRLRNMAIEQSPVSIVITDPYGNIEYVNRRFTVLTGYSSGEVIGKNPSVLKSGYHTAEFYKEMWNTIRAGRNWSGEMKNKNKKGEFYWESVVISPMKDDQERITHFIGIKEDITDKKAMFENLITAKEKAEESDKLKTAFLHNISHEIRTPLNAIVGFSSFFGDADLQEEKRKEYSDIIMQSNNQLLMIIEGIMKISHIEAGQVKLIKTETDIPGLINQIYSKFTAEASRKNLDFRINMKMESDELIILTDKVKLDQVISELLNNAIKFTQSGYVELGCLQNGQFLKFYVEDSGIGIPEDQHERIFERFYQADKSKSRVYGGTGLGLSISDAYVKILGGKFSLKSAPGNGAVFSFTIPFGEVD